MGCMVTIKRISQEHASARSKGAQFLNASILYDTSGLTSRRGKIFGSNAKYFDPYASA